MGAGGQEAPELATGAELPCPTLAPEADASEEESDVVSEVVLVVTADAVGSLSPTVSSPVTVSAATAAPAVTPSTVRCARSRLAVVALVSPSMQPPWAPGLGAT